MKVRNNLEYKFYNFLANLKHISKDSFVIDIGANIGDVTGFLYEKFEPTIYSYEPNISCYKFMLDRFKDKPKINLFNTAVSNFDGKSNLYFHKNSKGINDVKYIQGATLRPEKDNIDNKKKIEIECINIKNILEENKKIDLIKIDIEGSEYSIMPEIINYRDKIKMVICETHGNPFGKKIYNDDKTKLVMKNEVFKSEYLKLKSELISKNLYGNWFYEWF